MIIDREGIKRSLSQAQRKFTDNCPPLPGIQSVSRQPAAVLIPLLDDGESWKLLFIKRTHQQNDRHSGQIAFPGGRSEPSDPSLLHTALREAREEIGLNPADIAILGQSCTITTVTEYEVSPFIGALPWPYPLQLSPVEVEKTIIIPLDWLADPQHRKMRTWHSRSAPGWEGSVIFFDEYEGEILWGATARLVVDFLNTIGFSA